MDAASCEVEGNSDLYGRGIRLGFYIQWVSTLLITLFKHEDESLYRVVNLVLQLAVFASLLFLTVENAIYAFEVMIAFWLLFGALSSLTGDGISPLGTLSGFARIVMYAALSGYGVWFWFLGGVDSLPATPCDPVVFFGGVSPHGGFQIFGKIVTVVGSFVCGSLLLWIAGLFLRRIHRSISGQPAKNNLTAREKRQPMSSHRPKTEVSLLVLSVFVIIFSIVSVEKLIQDNRVVGVDAAFQAGQLIPLLVGVIGLFNTLLSILVRKSVFKPRCWVLFGYHLT
ncbi:hypothetical protein BR93DRAFT_12796 [Coniochaeta sp. PMI_546]|nr:hypothetical protein BR93DRAFT_12796 [Coniochaeta sp. PMI_546]